MFMFDITYEIIVLVFLFPYKHVQTNAAIDELNVLCTICLYFGYVSCFVQLSLCCTKTHT